MKVLLVRPMVRNAMTIFGGICCEPLELEYLSAACRNAGVPCALYDAVTESRRFTDVLHAEKPDVVGITGYLNQEREMRAYARLAKRGRPGCLVIFGGVHAQLNYRRLYWPETDFVFRSESAVLFADLAARLGRGEAPGAVPGLCRRTGAGFDETPYEPGDLDELPLPDRSGWRGEWFRYLDFPRLSTLKTAASCPYRCSFCYGRGLHGGVYQPRRLDLVLDELSQCQGETVFIVDSDFLLEEDRVRAFLEGVRNRNIVKRYICYARADFIASHPGLAAELCRAGFRAFLVGLEGVEDERLDRWEKGTSRRVNEACVRLLRENGADCVALLLADPSFRRGDFGSLYRWVRDQGIRYASVQVLTPIPPTAFYEERKGDLLTRDLRAWDLMHLVLPPEHMGRVGFMLRYRILMARLGLLGWVRGGFRFVGPGWLWQVWRRDRARRRVGGELGAAHRSAGPYT